MLAIVIALLVFSQLVSHTLKEHLQGFAVLLILSISLPKQVLFYLLATFIYIICQIFLSFFFKKPKRKKSTTPASSSDPINDDDIAAVEEAEYDAQVEQDDEGQIAHDEPIVLSIHDEAIEIMREQGVEMTRDEEESALNLFPKVSLII